MQSLLTSLWWTQFAAWKAWVTSLASDNYPQEIDWDGLPKRLGTPSCLLYFFPQVLGPSVPPCLPTTCLVSQKAEVFPPLCSKGRRAQTTRGQEPLPLPSCHTLTTPNLPLPHSPRRKLSTLHP